MKLEFSLQLFDSYSNIKFNDIPCSGVRVVTYGRTDRQTDITKLTVAFRNFAKAPKICPSSLFYGPCVAQYST